MKIAILGTRGIPNIYGGFEECAEHISKYFVKQGHDVTVYTPDYHATPSGKWKGVTIRKIFSKENYLGPFGNLIYEFLSIKDASLRDFDVLLELGTEYALSYPFFSKKDKIIVTNIDGIETRREKWSPALRYVLAKSIKYSLKLSDAIVADNPRIKDYADKLFNISSVYIGYGALLNKNKKPEAAYLAELNLEPFSYCLSVARLEPENNVDMIIAGYIKSQKDLPLIVVGPTNRKYGKYLVKKYKDYDNIKFVGGIYGNNNLLNSLRYYAHIYFHGHSVGGTNPALLQAMAQGAMIFAHDNEFNKYVLNENAIYFKSSSDLGDVIRSFQNDLRDQFIQNNFQRIEDEFNWETIAEKYLKLFSEEISKKEKKK